MKALLVAACCVLAMPAVAQEGWYSMPKDLSACSPTESPATDIKFYQSEGVKIRMEDLAKDVYTGQVIETVLMTYHPEIQDWSGPLYFYGLGYCEKRRHEKLAENQKLVSRYQ